MGAPVKAFNRISKEPIRMFCDIKEPDVVIVLDPTLLEQQSVYEGLKKGGRLIANTSQSPSIVKEAVGAEEVFVYTVDANRISYEELGRVLPNTCMLGALIKVENIMPLQAFLEGVKEDFSKKFKEEIVNKNISAIKRAYEEVKGDA
jgi:pyruvate ferredoxin oxidoreductase gamma subunit